MADPLNTHSYDGKLDISRLTDIISIQKFSLDEKRYRGNELRRILKLNPIATKYLDGIVTSMGTSANIDSTNGLIADDLICLCWTHRENLEFVSVLETQLMDMATGFCPQGRTHRLFQILLAFS
jgi:hypothetical protein